MRRCPACGLRFLAEIDPADSHALYHADYFHAYDGGDYEASEPQRRREARVRLEWMRAWAKPPGRLLEVGAAAGYFLDEARRAGFEPVGVEPAADLARKAASRFQVPVHAAFLPGVELPAANFDVVCAWHVVEHIPEPLPALEALRAAAAPSGHLFIEVPNADGVIARRQGAAWPPLGLPHHVGQYGPSSLSALLARARFEIVALDTVPFWEYGHRRGPGAIWRLARAAAVSARARKPLGGSHPSAHDLLRIVARPGS